MSVALFKDPSPEGPDAFVLALARRGIAARCIQVLETTLEIAGVAAALASTDLAFDAIVLTSHRAGDALGEAIKRVPPDIALRLCVPTFVVGRRTAEAARAALPTLPPDLIMGADVGSAEKLAPVVLRELSTRLHRDTGDFRPPSILFLCGDKRLDTLPRQLAAGGMVVTELVAYTTSPASIGSELFPEVPPSVDHTTVTASASGTTSGSASLSGHGVATSTASRSSGGAGGVVALVFFSPSGCDVALGSVLVMQAIAAGVPCFALGPTTAQALESRGIRVAGVAEFPNPECLAEAVFRELAHHHDPALAVTVEPR